MENTKVLSYVSELLSQGMDVLEDNLKINGSNINHREIYFKIKEHVDMFLDGYLENRFITLIGLRGVGKTTSLFQIYDYLINEKKISKNRVLYIPADELDYLGTDLYEIINVFIKDIHNSRITNLNDELFILIDEAQYDKKWSRTGKIIYDKTKKIFMIFTGSSALDFEMNVDAVRRIKKELVFPMNFNEYNLLKNKISPPKGYEKILMKLIFTGNVEDAIKKENEMSLKLLTFNKPVVKEWEKFLLFRDFPYGLDMKKEDVFIRTFNMINRIIEKDVFRLKSFNTDTISTINQIITYIGLQDPGGTSDKKLGTILSKSAKSIREILDVLEKTHLIFSVKPYGSGGKQIRKPWKYYFLSQSINATIRYKFGKFNIYDRKFLGLLAENFVASYLFKLRESINQYLNIYYDPSINGVDFLIDFGNKLIPIEVGLGKKDKKQITKAIAKYKSEYGIIISNTIEKIRKEDNIIYIPLIAIS
jgi:predicted AAA+ superfamily ATPase